MRRIIELTEEELAKLKDDAEWGNISEDAAVRKAIETFLLAMENHPRINLIRGPELLEFFRRQFLK